MSDYEFHTEPMKHQIRALRKIISTKGRTMLLMDPGLGKTKPVLDYIAMMALKFGTLRVMVTAPLSAVDTWELQAHEHMPRDVLDRTKILLLDEGSILDKAKMMKDLATPGWWSAKEGQVTMVVVNHDVFGSRKLVPGLKTVTVADRIVSALEAFDPDLTVIDESHRFKGYTSNRNRTLRRGTKNCPRRIGMTGTVAPRNILDVYGQWRLVNPTRWPDRYTDFEQRYAVFGGYEGREIIAWQRLEEFRAKMLEDAFVARKEDTDMDLPPVTDTIIPVTLGTKERKAYDQMAAEMVAELDGVTSISSAAIVKLLRLRQITGGMLPWIDEHGETQGKRIGDAKLKMCRDKVRTLVDAGEKIVIFAHFRADVASVYDSLKRMGGLGWVNRIDGDTPQQQRVQLRKGFATWKGPAVLVAQMRTMSLAVNELVCASHGIYFSMSERRDDYDQSRRRLDRKGQTRPVTFHHLVVPNSIDTVMLRGHQQKLDLEHAITDLRHDLGLWGDPDEAKQHALEDALTLFDGSTR